MERKINTVPLEIIERWLKDEDCDVRTAAMNACAGREVPLEIIEQGLKDADCDVRAAAMNACAGREVPLEMVRSFDPPAKVYKKCVGGVIVEAEISKDAMVRGGIGEKCRSSKAIITNIIGTFGGAPIGISRHNNSICYMKGDIVEIENFDLSYAECSTGFHFFCTKEEAENY